MPGIYIHIPFCKQACHYCDFHFSTSLKNKDAVLFAIKKEIILQKNYLNAKKISTVYFGGGTPSLLSQKEVMEIFDELNKYFEIGPDAEITLEANPDDLTQEKISELKQTPVNRLSIGIQSFSDEDLKFMNRAHNSADADRSVKTAQDKGFENITIDLIYGTPTLSKEEWKKNLSKVFALNVPHISAYCLTVEPRTALADMIKRKKSEPVDEQKSSEQFEIMLEEMKRNNFIQYEISNFCRGESYSKHNSNYWKGKHYLGLGPSAHSFDGSSRQWNVRNNNEYIRSIEEGKLFFEKEILTIYQRYNEYVLTSLRTMWGTDIECIKNKFGSKYYDHCLQEAESWISSSHLTMIPSPVEKTEPAKRTGMRLNAQKKNKLVLTDKGKLLADKIASDLFIT